MYHLWPRKIRVINENDLQTKSLGSIQRKVDLLVHAEVRDLHLFVCQVFRPLQQAKYVLD
jgi:hypothetical protein